MPNWFDLNGDRSIAFSRVARNAGFAIADCVRKKLKLFFTLQTLNENGVEAENSPSYPAQNQRAVVSSVGGNSGFDQCLQGFSCQIRSSTKVRLIKS